MRRKLHSRSSFPTGAILPLDIAPEGVSYLTLAEKRNIQAGENRPDEDPSAWENLTNTYWQTPAWLRWWMKMDYGAGGYLPGGYDPDAVAAADAETKAELRRIRAKAEADAAAAKQELDFAKKSWYEMFGLFQSDQEKEYQAMQDYFAGELIKRDLKDKAQNINISIPDSISPEQPKSTLLNYALLAIAGIAVLVGVSK